MKRYEHEFYNFQRNEENKKDFCRKNNEKYRPGCWVEKKEE